MSQSRIKRHQSGATSSTTSPQTRHVKTRRGRHIKRIRMSANQNQGLRRRNRRNNSHNRSNSRQSNISLGDFLSVILSILHRGAIFFSLFCRGDGVVLLFLQFMGGSRKVSFSMSGYSVPCHGGQGFCPVHIADTIRDKQPTAPPSRNTTSHPAIISSRDRLTEPSSHGTLGPLSESSVVSSVFSDPVSEQVIP